MERVVIQSDMGNLPAVETFIDHICDEWHINNYAATISMSVLQAVENAIKHGNKDIIEKTVTVSCDKCRGGLRFSIKDEGDGFDYASYVCSESKSNNASGLFIMNSLSDKMMFSEGGSRVSMDFMINGIDSSRAIERMSVLHQFFRHEVLSFIR